MVVRHGSREEDRIRTVADTSDIPALERMLGDWLASHGWSRSRWYEFRADFRSDGKPVTVRAG
jgi:hypothetical protein